MVKGASTSYSIPAHQERPGGESQVCCHMPVSWLALVVNLTQPRVTQQKPQLKSALWGIILLN